MTETGGLDGATAAILAGGLGTRLRSVVADRPKVLAPVQGRPFLAYLLDQLGAAGIRRTVLCTGYLADQIRDAFGTDHHGMELLYSVETEPLGTAGALRLALPELGSGPVLVMNGDSYCATDLFEFWEWHHRRPAHLSLVLTEVEDAGRFGRVDTDANGRVTAFHEKTADGTPGTINAGIYILETALLGRVPEGKAVSLERDLFPTWTERFGVFGYGAGRRFIDIGTPESFGRAESFVTQIAAEHA